MTTPPFDPQPCCDASSSAAASCTSPIQFCQTSTATGPVDHPGRMYDLTLPINQGFTVDSMQVDAVSNAAGITWSIFDVDGDQFAADLKTFMQGRLPSGTVVTVTNPNTGVTELCGAALPMQVHIECIRLDRTPPNLIELVYNGGEDLVQNPGYNEVPPFNIHQPCGFHLPKRQDEGGTLACTSVANRGWETNDSAQTFEIWCDDVRTAQNTTPTPRGTPVQEISSFGSGNANRATIWQTFNVASAGTFNIRVVHGARDTGEEHRITLSTGDTNDNPVGDILTDVTTPPSVTASGGPNPWTSYATTQSLASGVYTLALSTTNPVGAQRGGLFTDMRVFVDRPGLRATATSNDDTCVVTVTETSTTTTCTFWQPKCTDGTITSWVKVEDGLTLTNALFWAQVPKPSCCSQEAQATPGGGSSLSNMLASDVVCVVVGGVPQPAIRMVVTDPSGGTLQEQFLSPNGVPVTPDSWTAGPCTSNRQLNDEVLCDLGQTTLDPITGSLIPTSFLRKYVQSLSDTGQGQINSVRDFTLDGSSTYVPVGPVTQCGNSSPADRETVCWTTTAGGGTVFTGTIRHDDSLPAPGWLLFDQNQTLVLSTTPGLTFVSCSPDPFSTTGLCLADGTPIAVATRWNHATGTYVDDGWINLVTGAFSAGNPPVGTVACGTSQSIQVSGVFCDVTGTTVNALVLIEYHYNPDGSIASVRIVNATTGTTHVPVGTITTCPTGASGPEQDIEVLCDVNAGVATPFVRDYRRDSTGAITSVSNYTLAGAAYTPTGTVGVCPTDAAQRDVETLILCDATPTRFLRAVKYNSVTGAVATVTDTTLDGTTAFTPVGAVSICTQPTATDFDFTEEILCDANGTAFIRRFTFNSVTGVVTATTNLTLAGAAFTPVGAVGLCSACCPSVVGNGCTNTGSGTYVAIRATNGTISLLDAVTGATILAANIVACPGDNVVKTLTAQARIITNATPWTPGADVVGTLTSLTVTGVGGLWDLVDQNGTVLTGLPAGLSLTWEAEDDNTLSGPTSVTPQSGASVVANWTQR